MEFGCTGVGIDAGEDVEAGLGCERGVGVWVIGRGAGGGVLDELDCAGGGKDA